MKIRTLTMLFAILAVAAILMLTPPAVLRAIVDNPTMIEEPPMGEGTAESPWLVSNANELYWVASNIHDGSVDAPTAYVKLTADITVNEDVLNADGELNGSGLGLYEWTPITANIDVDGDFHTISGLYTNGSQFAGLFTTSGTHSASFRNLGVTDSYFKSTESAGTFIAFGWNGSYSVDNCFSTATVISTGSDSMWNCVGGLVGRIKSTYGVRNSLFLGKVTGAGTYAGAISGYSVDALNCYYLSGCAMAQGSVCQGIGPNKEDVDGCTNAVSAGELASGKVACLLQGAQESHVWGQTVGTDALPVFGGAKVYAHYTGCQLIGFSNTPFTGTIAHQHNDRGVCEACGEWEPALLITEENYAQYGLTEAHIGYYAIGNYGQLYSFVKESNIAINSLNGVLIDDITVNAKVLENGALISDPSALIEWMPLREYEGTFDGNGHAISGLYAVSSDYLGFVSIGSGTVKNLLVTDTYFSSSKYSGGIFAYLQSDASVTGCGFDGYITSSSTRVGGVAGYMSSQTCAILDCYNLGTVVSTNSSGYAGGIVGSNGEYPVKNCYNAGSVSGAKYNGAIVGLGYGTIENCYYLENSAPKGLGNKEDNDLMTKRLTEAEVMGGKLAYTLNASSENYAWGQNLSGGYPIPNGMTVYAVYENSCVITSYSNDADHAYGSPDHDHVNGICTVCGDIMPATLITAENLADFEGLNDSYIGYYAIANYGQLVNYRDALIHGLDIYAKGVLVADVTINTGVLLDGALTENTEDLVLWIPIGNTAAIYRGTFDGNGHKISGLYVVSSEERVGLFGDTSGATICDLTLEDSYIKGANYTGGIVGYLYGGNLFDVSVNAAVVGGDYVGGIAGYAVTASDVSGITVRGSVNGGAHVGGVFGRAYLGNVATYNLTNSQNYASVTGAGNYVGGFAGLITGVQAEYLENHGAVQGASYVGGIFGENASTVIRVCFNTADISGASYVGGITGQNGDEIYSCYNTGDITGLNNGTHIGGISGYAGNMMNYIDNSYNTGAVTGGDYLGAICENFTSKTNYFLIGSVEGATGTENLISLTAEDFASGKAAWLMNGGGRLAPTDGTQTWYQTIGTDLSPMFTGATVYYGYATESCDGSARTYSNDVLYMDAVHGYSENGVCDCGHMQPPVKVTAENRGAYGLDESYIGYYATENMGNLYWYTRLVSDALGYDFFDGDNTASAVLVSDITVNESVVDAADRSTLILWEVAATSFNNGLRGTFDGNGYTLSGVYAPMKNGTLFQYIEGEGSVKNLTVKDSVFRLATIAAYNKGTIENCHSSAALVYAEDEASYGMGGICSDNYDTGLISGCSFSGTVSLDPDGRIGGIVSNNGGTVEYCFNTADILFATSMVGGIVAENRGAVTYCYNTGDLSASSMVGGICGYAYVDASITHCYSIGMIEGKYNVGGILGASSRLDEHCVSDCYYLKNSAVDVDGMEYFDDPSSGTGRAYAGGIGAPQYYDVNADVPGFTDAVEAADVEGGALTFLLNGSVSEGDLVWGQDLETEAYPVLGGKTVYKNFYCNGNYIYQNTAQTSEHTDLNEYGYCEHCQLAITGAYVQLGTDLTLLYSVDIRDNALAESLEGFAMRFTVNDKTTVVALNSEKTDADGEYLFALGLAPQCMTDTVKAELLLDGEIVASKAEYSIRAYADALLEEYAGMSDDASVKLTTLVTDMLHYGAAAQTYRNYKTDTLANAGIAGDASSEIPDSTDKLLVTEENVTLGDVYFTGVTVRFDNFNRIVIHVNSAENATVKVDGRALAFDGNTVYTEPIYATAFDKVYAFELYDGETLVQTLYYSVSSYVYSMQSSENAAMKNLATALYNYGVSTKAYAVSALS